MMLLTEIDLNFLTQLLTGFENIMHLLSINPSVLFKHCCLYCYIHSGILVDFVSVWNLLIFLLFVQFGDLDNLHQLSRTAPSMKDSSCLQLFTSKMTLRGCVNINMYRNMYFFTFLHYKLRLS